MGLMGALGFMAPKIPIILIPYVLKGFTQEAAEPARIITDFLTDLRFDDAHDGSNERTRSVVRPAVPPGTGEMPLRHRPVGRHFNPTSAQEKSRRETRTSRRLRPRNCSTAVRTKD